MACTAAEGERREGRRVSSAQTGPPADRSRRRPGRSEGVVNAAAARRGGTRPPSPPMPNPDEPRRSNEVACTPRRSASPAHSNTPTDDAGPRRRATRDLQPTPSSRTRPAHSNTPTDDAGPRRSVTRDLQPTAPRRLTTSDSGKREVRSAVYAVGRDVECAQRMWGFLDSEKRGPGWWTAGVETGSAARC